jgi:hypothetical protein
VIVTGVSGGGRSTVARALENVGYYVVDNLPQALMVQMAELAAKAGGAAKAAKKSGGTAKAAKKAGGSTTRAGPSTTPPGGDTAGPPQTTSGS